MNIVDDSRFIHAALSELMKGKRFDQLSPADMSKVAIRAAQLKADEKPVKPVEKQEKSANGHNNHS